MSTQSPGGRTGQPMRPIAHPPRVGDESFWARLARKINLSGAISSEGGLEGQTEAA